MWCLWGSLSLMHRQLHSRVLLSLYVHASLTSCVSWFLFIYLFIYFLAMLLCFWVLVSRPGIEIGPLAVKVLSPNHWPCRKFCSLFLYREPSDWTTAYPSDFVEFNYLVKNITYKYSHIPKCWGLGLLQIIF